jgi:RNA polymerase sporulation-specific sigma factor
VLLLDKSVLTSAKAHEMIMETVIQSEDAVKFIKHVLRTYTGSPEKFMLNNRIEFEDLMQLGKIGLYKAIQKINIDMDVKEIQRYIYLTIQSEFRNVSRSNDSNAIVINQRIRGMYTKYLQYHKQFFEDNQKDPSIADVMENFLINEDDAFDLVYGMQATIAIEAKVQSRTGSISILDIVRDTSLSVEEQVIRKVTLEETLAQLGEKERTVIEMRYLLDYSNQEIADKMGVSYNSVVGYIKKAFKTLGLDVVKTPYTFSNKLKTV